MLAKRIVSSLLLIGFIVSIVFSEWVTGLAVVVFVALGLYEFFTMLEKKGIAIYKNFGVLLGALIPVLTALRFEPSRAWELLFIVVLSLALIIMQFLKHNNSGAVVDISTTIFGILYVAWFLTFLIKIRQLPGGMGLFAAVLIITKLGDIGAYLVGVRFGRKPLIPRISPNKSIEGAVGGLFFSILGALVSQPMVGFSYAHMLFVGFFLGVLGQLGDLSESLIKRDCQVKDAGSAFPGMGGVLDVIDSLLFTAPTFYFYINAIRR